MYKNIKFDDDLANQIQQFANSKTDGNFTQAVDLLIRSALLSDIGLNMWVNETPIEEFLNGDIEVEIINNGYQPRIKNDPNNPPGDE